MRVLLTRPIDDAREEAQHLKAQGFDVIISPASKIESADALPPLEKYAAVLFTSANAVKALQGFLKEGDPLLQTPAYCVGAKTAQAARGAGFQIIEEGHGTVDSLLKVIESEPHDGERWAYFSGDIIRHDPEPRLKKLGLTLDHHIIYHARAIADLSGEAAKALQEKSIDVILFYSPRAVELFADQVKKAGLDVGIKDLHALCLSADVGARARKLGFETITTAKESSARAMHEALNTIKREQGGKDMVDSAEIPAEKGKSPWRYAPWAMIALLLAFIAGLFAMPVLAPKLAPYIPWFQTQSTSNLERLSQDIEQLKAERTTPASPGVDYGPRLNALEARIEGLDRPRDTTRLNDLETRIYTLETQVERLSGLGPDPLVSARLEALEERLNQLRIEADTDLGPALSTLAFATLKDRVASGGPFIDSLDALSAHMDDPAIDQLRPYAVQGIATPAELSARFSKLSADIIRAAKTPENAGWWDKTLARAQTLVTVRKTGESDGTTPEAIVSRAEKRIEEGDFRGARGALQSLPRHVLMGPVLKPWLDDMDALLRVEEMLIALESALDKRG